MQKPKFTVSLAQSILSSSCLLTIACMAPALLPTEASANSSFIQMEKAKRQLEFREAMAKFDSGRQFFEAGDFENAVFELRDAYELMPQGPNTAGHVDSLEQWYVAALLARAEQMSRDEGRRLEGSKLAQRALEIRPLDPAAQELMAEFNNPNSARLGPIANTPTHSANVAKVKELLALAESQYRLAKYDAAIETYNKVLLIDNYNSAAQRGMERVAREKAKYGESAYNRTRVELLSQVSNAWALPVPIEVERLQFDGTEGGPSINPNQSLRSTLEKMVISEVAFKDTPLEQVVDYLRAEVRRQTPADDKVINFFVNIQEADAAAAGSSGFATDVAPAASTTDDRLVTLNLTNVNVIDLLEFISAQTNTAYNFDRGTVVIRGSQETTVITETFDVPPSFIDVLLGSGGGGGGGGAPGGDPFAPVAAPSGGGGAGARTARAALEGAGIVFDAPGSFARFSNVTQRLQVGVTADQMALVEQIVIDVRNQGPKQVKITTKFIEVSENKEDEFGFDWLLGQFNIPGSGRTFGSGGSPTTGSGFPFVFPDSGQDGIPVGGSQLGSNRSGGVALNSGAIDRLLSTGTAVAGDLAPTPGLFSLAGVFTDPQFQVVLRALNQSTGTDLMTAPSIVTAPGTDGKIEIIREFIYPGDYDPPEIPQNIGNGGGNNNNGINNGQANAFPVTPSTPRDWQTQNLGVTLLVNPTVSRDNTTIRMNLNPEIAEFEGFINYGTPIQTAAINALGQPVNVTLTENRILQPVFSKRTVQTSATIYDGSTLAIGGLIREDVQQFEDKLPILGDIPVVGRLFQSRGESHLKRNLVIFVTGEIIGPDGRPLRSVGVPQGENPVQITEGIGAMDGGIEPLFDFNKN